MGLTCRTRGSRRKAFKTFPRLRLKPSSSGNTGAILKKLVIHRFCKGLSFFAFNWDAFSRKVEELLRCVGSFAKAALVQAVEFGEQAMGFEERDDSGYITAVGHEKVTELHLRTYYKLAGET